MDRWVKQPRHPCSPEDKRPKGAGQLLLAARVPPTRARRLELCQCCHPGLVPAPIADRIAQHQHGIEMLCAKASGAILSQASEHDRDHGEVNPSFFTFLQHNQKACSTFMEESPQAVQALPVRQFPGHSRRGADQLPVDSGFHRYHTEWSEDVHDTAHFPERNTSTPPPAKEG